MKVSFKHIFITFLAVVFVFIGMTTSADAAREKKSTAQLDKAKKAGDLSEAQAEKYRENFGKEADEANIESFDTKVKEEGAGNSTYGVVGFDYLTGVGKVASSPDKIGANLPAALGGGKLTANLKTPFAKKMKRRFKTKWTGQLGDTYSGWTKDTGVTEVWFRGKGESQLGANYNEWVNQWNNITRPDYGQGETPVKGSDPDQGAHWFSFYCIHCHGWTGKGNGPTAAKLDPRPRNMTNGAYLNYISNLQLFTVIKGGGTARNLANCMPPWGNVLQDQDIWNTIAFIRTLAVPKYEPDPDDVTAANAKDSQDFKDLNEELELEGVMAGRGGGLVGGYNSIGGGRLASERVGISAKTSGHSGNIAGAAEGDWALDTKISGKYK